MSFLVHFQSSLSPFSSAISHFPPVCPSSHLCFYYAAHHVFQIYFLISPYSVSQSTMPVCVCLLSLPPHLSFYFGLSLSSILHVEGLLSCWSTAQWPQIPPTVTVHCRGNNNCPGKANNSSNTQTAHTQVWTRCTGKVTLLPVHPLGSDHAGDVLCQADAASGSG